MPAPTARAPAAPVATALIATTVAATMICAHLAGIKVFATGGIGGVHRGAEASFDISADLEELKYLIRRKRWDQHLFESEEYRQAFYGGDLGRVVSGSSFRVQIKGNRTIRKDSL